MGASCPGRRHWEGRQKRNIQCRPNRVALTLAKFSTVVRKKLLSLIELFLSYRLGKQNDTKTQENCDKFEQIQNLLLQIIVICKKINC